MGVQVGERMLAEGNSTRQAVRERSKELFQLVGLTAENLSRYPHELSGGMKQRAAIAMALTMGPDVVILDEPTSALDVSVQAQIINLLKRLKWELGLSMLFITHDIALASDISDSLAVIHAGELREYGTAEDVLLRPADPYTQALVGSIPRLHGDKNPEFVSGAPPDPADLPEGCRFNPRCRFVFGPCRRDPPPLIQVGAGHHARCWLYDPRYRDAATAAGFADGDAE
jgi:oligopeptide/dipeptide ABC transporter ATP-binding protein